MLSEEVSNDSTATVQNYVLLDYVEIVVRHKKVVSYVTLIAIVLSIAVSFILPNKYLSTARILPPQQDNSFQGLMLGSMSGGAGNLFGDLFGRVSPADQCAAMLESDRISDVIIDRFKLMNVYDVKYRLDMRKVLDELVDIQVGTKDGIVSITVCDSLPQRAADIANAYIEELGKLTAEMSNSNSTNNRQFLEKRLVQARSDLANAEDAVKRFQTMNKTIDITEQAKATVESIAQLQAQLSMQEINLAALKRRLTDNSPEVKDATVAVAKIKANIAQWEGNGGSGAIPTVGSVPEVAQKYVRLFREFKAREYVLELLTKQYEMAAYSEAKDVTTINVIQYARPSDKKSKPKRRLIVLIGAVAGFIGSIFVMFVMEYFQRLPLEERSRIHGLAQQLKSWRSSHN